MRKKRQAYGTGNEGFTLMEIILVLVLIGIMATVLIPTLRGDAELHGDRDPG